MRGLIIREPWIGHILSGRKTWEIRSKGTAVRGPIALIRGGSGLVVGIADLVDSHGPFSLEQLVAHHDKHAVPRDVLVDFVGRYRGQAHAWVLANVHALHQPVPYEHPSGAVIWVNLDELELPRSEAQQPESASRDVARSDRTPVATESDPRRATSFYLCRKDGTAVYPVKITDRDTGISAFQVLARGSNRKADARHTTDERLLQQWVLNEGLRVRCQPEEGGSTNAHSIGGGCTPIIITDLLADA